MSASRSDDSPFDRMLAGALKKHREPVPADFTARVLQQIELADERRLLSRIVWQERMALAACVAVALGVVVVAGAFPGAAEWLFQHAIGAVTQQGTDVFGSVLQKAEALKLGSGFWLALIPVGAFALYAILDAAFGDRLSTA